MSKKRFGKYIFQYLIFCVIFSLIAFFAIEISSFLFKRTETNASVEQNAQSSHPLVIIDAGHGGEDGGAVGKNGVYEKDLNLMIANELSEILSLSGIDVIMTRSDDRLLYDRSIDYQGRKKVLDLAARLKIANENENAIFISIHMNSFPEERYHGLQVYYSKNDERSAALAKNIQASVKEHLQKDNERSCKAASDNIFLLDRARGRAVLIECGFLSNTNECEALTDPDYRKMLSLAIFNGIYEHIIEVGS